MEVDGRDYHSAPAAFQRDRHRQNALVAAGWQVLRFAAADVLRRPGWIAAQVKSMLNRLAAPRSAKEGCGCVHGDTRLLQIAERAPD